MMASIQRSVRADGLVYSIDDVDIEKHPAMAETKTLHHTNGNHSEQNKTSIPQNSLTSDASSWESVKSVKNDTATDTNNADTGTVAWLQPRSPPLPPAGQTRLSSKVGYIQRRTALPGINLESNASDFETDANIQAAKSKMLREKQLQHKRQHCSSHLSLASSHSMLSNDKTQGGKPRYFRRQSRDSIIRRISSSSTSRGRGWRRGRRGGGREKILGKTPSVIVSLIIFLVLFGAGVGIGLVIRNAKSEKMREEAHLLALETGSKFSEQLDKAILPLFSMAQLAVHLDIFQTLPERIGPAGADGSLPLNETTWKRNITGVCDDPTLMETFSDIATTIRDQSEMKGILAGIQLQPYGVICLLHPMNNTEDFMDDGLYLDSTPIWGLDILQDPSFKFIASQSIAKETVGIAGPLELRQCPECDRFFIARLPVIDESHSMVVEGKLYKRWGFATALIAWQALVEKTGVHDTFQNNEFEFRLTRTDRTMNTDTLEYEVVVVILDETPLFEEKSYWKRESIKLDTTNNEWEMTISYNPMPMVTTVGLIVASWTLVAFLISILVYTILSQKHEQEDMLVEAYAQDARVATERNMTAYFAHELRNPLSAMDSALSSINVNEMPEETRDLLDSMQLCSSFMSSIMNNLLDVRKIEEGKMRIRSRPLSLSKLVDSTHSMMKPSVRQGVEFRVEKNLPKGRNWVLGDEHRIQQVLTNVITNAIKYTLNGSITLAVYWEDHLVILDCVDTGPGIPKQEQKHMFERFVQRGGAPGTGLGLNIALKIVSMMDGTIGFESDPTIAPGTTCRVKLPLLLWEEPEELPAAANNTDEMIEDSIKILIIDDIKMNRTMLSRRLKKAIAPNAIISMAETAEQALEMCEQTEFDIIICDQFMEEAGGVMVGTDGIIAMRRMRVSAIIIGCSGNDLDKEFFEAGADWVWGKPMPSNSEIIAQFRKGLQARDPSDDAASFGH